MKTTLAAATAAVILTAALGLARAQTDTGTTVKQDARTAGHAIAHGATTVGHSIAATSRKVGHRVAVRTRPARETIKADSVKAGHAIAHGARRFGADVRRGAHEAKAAMTHEPADHKPND